MNIHRKGAKVAKKSTGFIQKTFALFAPLR